MSTPLFRQETLDALKEIAKDLDGPPFRSMCAHEDAEIIYALHGQFEELVKALLEAKEP